MSILYSVRAFLSCSVRNITDAFVTLQVLSLEASSVRAIVGDGVGSIY